MVVGKTLRNSTNPEETPSWARARQREIIGKKLFSVAKAIRDTA